MEDIDKKIISKLERNKIIESATIIHQIIEEISEKDKKSIWEKLFKHPIFVLFVGAIVSGVIIFEYQNRQTRISENIKAKYELIKETSCNTGGVIAAAENVIYLHEKPIRDEKQQIKTREAFNTALDKFKSNFIIVGYKIKVIFNDKEINEEWKGIEEEIDEMHSRLDYLEKLHTDDTTDRHPERIDLCKDKIDRIRAKMDRLSGFMIDSLK